MISTLLRCQHHCHGCVEPHPDAIARGGGAGLRQVRDDARILRPRRSQVHPVVGAEEGGVRDDRRSQIDHRCALPREDREPAAAGGDGPDREPPAEVADDSAPAAPAAIADDLPWPGELDEGWREPVPAEPVGEAGTAPPKADNGAEQVSTGMASDPATPADVTLPAAVAATPLEEPSPHTEAAPVPVTGKWA